MNQPLDYEDLSHKKEMTKRRVTGCCILLGLLLVSLVFIVGYAEAVHDPRKALRGYSLAPVGQPTEQAKQYPTLWDCLNALRAENRGYKAMCIATGDKK